MHVQKSLVNRGWRMNMTIKCGRLRLVSPCLGDVKSCNFLIINVLESELYKIFFEEGRKECYGERIG